MKNASQKVAGLVLALFIVLGAFPGIGIGAEKTASRSGEDIAVWNLTVEKTLLFLGDLVVIKATVSNFGSIVADNMTVNITARNDTGPAIVIASLNNTTVQNITVSGFYDVSVDWNTSKAGYEAMPGINYTINVTAWNGTDVASDPTPANNTALLNVTFKDMSYILMTNITLSSIEVVKGDQMNLTVNISNLGNKATAFAGSSATLHAYLDNATLASNTTIIQNIPARTNISARINITDTNFYSLGNHSFFVELFKSGQSGPRLSDINLTTSNFGVVYPNVYLDNVSLYPDSVVVGETMLINATIANNGTAKKDLVKVFFYMDYKDPLSEIWNTTVNVSALGANTTSYVWNTSKFKAGPHEVFVSLEPAWPSFMNKSLVLKAGGLVNLKVENITMDPLVTKIGETVAISARIANNGTWESFPTNATFSVVTDFVNKTMIGEVAVAPLLPGSKTTVTLNFNSTGLAFKNYRVEVFVDKDCQNCEYEPSTDRLDNMLQVDFPIKADPDLGILTVNFTKGSTVDTNLTVGEIITINALIKNNGSDSSVQTTVDFTIQNDMATVNEKHTMNLYGLPPETEFTVQYTWDTNLYPTGNYTVKVEVDAVMNNSKDPDRTNNAVSVKTVLLPPIGIPNIKVLSFTVQPDIVVQKQRTTLTAQVENIGTQVAKGVEAKFSYKTATEFRTIDTHAEAELLVGDQMAFDMDWFTTLIPGNYTVRVDMSCNNGEKDSTDNFMETQVEITKAPVQGEPKVTIVSVEFDKNPKVGEMLSITVTIKNEGTADAKDVQVKLKVDGKPYGDPEPIALIPVGGESVAVFNYKVEKGTHSFEVTVLVGGDQHDTETGLEVKAKDEGIDNTTMMLALAAIVIVAIIIFLVLATRKATPEKGVIEEEPDKEEEEDEEDEEEEDEEEEDEDEEDEDKEEEDEEDEDKEEEDEEEEDEEEDEEEEDEEEEEEDEEGEGKKGK